MMIWMLTSMGKIDALVLLLLEEGHHRLNDRRTEEGRLLLDVKDLHHLQDVLCLSMMNQ